jgi:hypothetical protein
MENAEIEIGLEDLDPRGAILEIKVGEKVEQIQLKKFSLKAQLWIKREFGSAQYFVDALNPDSEINIEGERYPYIETVLKTVHYLMDDQGKTIFPDWESLAENVGTGVFELLQLQKALVATMGLAQPVIDKIDEDFKKKVEAELKKSPLGLK